MAKVFQLEKKCGTFQTLEEKREYRHTNEYAESHAISQPVHPQRNSPPEVPGWMPDIHHLHLR